MSTSVGFSDLADELLVEQVSLCPFSSCGKDREIVCGFSEHGRRQTGGGGQDSGVAPTPSCPGLAPSTIADTDRRPRPADLHCEVER